MKPLTLEISGAGLVKKESYDFRTKAGNLYAGVGLSTDKIRDMLSLALFGSADGRTVLFTYEHGGDVFTLKRNFSFDGEVELACGNKIVHSKERDVNKFIQHQIKMDKVFFDAFGFIEREKVIEGFAASAAGRVNFLTEFFSTLTPERTEIIETEKKLKDEYAKLGLKLEMSEEITPEKIDRVKAELEAATKQRADSEAKLKEIEESVAMAEKNIQFKKELDGAVKARDEVLKGEAQAEADRNKLMNSGKAETLYAMLEKRDEINAETEKLSKRAEELKKIIAEETEKTAAGEKSKKAAEENIIHCIERLEELRKKLYGSMDSLGGDACDAKIASYYKEEEDNITLFQTRKKAVEEEYKAAEATYKELLDLREKRTIPTDAVNAAREAAILEEAIAIINDNINAFQHNIEVCNVRMNEIRPQIADYKESVKKAKASVQSLNKQILGKYDTREEAVNAAVIRQQQLYVNHIYVATQEKECDAIERKIAENINGLNSYNEDMAALNSAKEGLDAYLAKVNEKVAKLETEMLELRSRHMYLAHLGNVEFGESCPVCRSVVLSKPDTDNEEKGLSVKIARLEKELEKGRSLQAEYGGKHLQVASKIGELEARIKTGEAYIKSLKESLEVRTYTIDKVFAEYGVKDSAALTAKLKEAIAYSNMLTMLCMEVAELEGNLLLQEGTLNLLAEEEKRIEEADLPRYIDGYNGLSAKLNEKKTAYEALQEILAGKPSSEWLDELAISEKELSTIDAEITAKRTKMLELLGEKEQINDMLIAMSSRNRIIKIDGEDCNYRRVVAKVLSSNMAEIVEEIKKSEEEIESFKVEVAAIRRVAAKHSESLNTAQAELNDIEAMQAGQRLATDELFAQSLENAKALGVDNKEQLKSMILNGDQKTRLLQRVAEYDEKKAVALNEVDRINARYENISGVSLEGLKEQVNEAKREVEQAIQDIAALNAKRADLKEKLKLYGEMKEEAEKYAKRVKEISEIASIVNDERMFTKYIVKKAGKTLSDITAGKYVLTCENDVIYLINKETGKNIFFADYSREERLLVALVLGTQLHKTVIEIIGGGDIALTFPIYADECGKACVRVMTNFTKNNVLLSLPKEEEFVNVLNKEMF